jgi:outer membrane protein assembly factor BamB
MNFYAHFKKAMTVIALLGTVLSTAGWQAFEWKFAPANSVIAWTTYSTNARVDASMQMTNTVTAGGKVYLPLVAKPAIAKEWAMAGANPQRTSWTAEEVRGQLRPVWYRPIESYILPRTQIIAANNTLYVATAHGLYAFASDSGAQRWVYPTELPLGNSPTVVNGVAYAGGFDHKLHAIDAFTGAPLWTFEAEAGFDTNPLVFNGIVYLGSRDGYMYAVYGHESALRGQLLWKYKTNGPIHFSAAYKDNVIYFASDDSYAYALNAQTGSLVWKSAKLPGAGFHSWWPVVAQNTVIFAGSNNYRHYLAPGLGDDLHGRETNDLYAANGIPSGSLIGARDASGQVDAARILQYLETKPWRRTYLVLNRDTGQEVTYDFDRDGQAEYAPITWTGTHGPGNRYPPVVGSNGKLYQTMHYRSDTYIPWGGIIGWSLGAAQFSTPGPVQAMDEPEAYSAGGNLIYWTLCCDRAVGAFDTAQSASWSYFAYNLQSLMPGYNSLYQGSSSGYTVANWFRGANGSVNGLSGQHGDQNPPIPYNGRVYLHRSNVLIAFANTSAQTQALPLARIVSPPAAGIRTPTVDELKQRLSQEVQRMLDAGHLRPGYLGAGLFDDLTKNTLGDNLIDYWHAPTDVLYTLALALPYLPANQQTAVRTYMQNEYTKYPPQTYAHIGWRDGAPREPYDLPPEVEADRSSFGPTQYAGYGYKGWTFPPHMFYALWKYAAATGNAATIFNATKDRLETPPSDAYLGDYPYVLNAYIAGYWGYLELQKLAGKPETASVRAQLNRLLALRVTTFNKDNPWPDSSDHMRTLNVARNFLFLVPELGQYLHDNALTKVQDAVNEYDYIKPYWFIAKAETAYHEGIIQPLFDSVALFQAKALILKDTRQELARYLDVPATERGDLYFIQNLVFTISAQSAP